MKKSILFKILPAILPVLSIILLLTSVFVLVPIARAETVAETVHLKNSRAYIQRLAFGYNDDNTCTAVAVGIALNYMDGQINKNLIPKEYKSESLTTNNVKDGYSQANSFHKYLANECGLVAASFSNMVVNGLTEYCIRNENAANMELRVSVSLYKTVGMKHIKEQIDKGMPVMITTTTNAGKYNFHTMVVYGYRKNADESYEILIHTGWDGENEIFKGNDGKYSSKGKWISSSVATWVYTFSYNDKPMKSSEPKLKGQQGNGGIKLTWQKIEGAEYYIIHRSTDNGKNYSQIAVTQTAVTAYTDSDNTVKKGTECVYKIKAAKKVTFQYYESGKSVPKTTEITTKDSNTVKVKK